ncbi:flavodoxin domain-containing protein [Halomarina pelagica]|uniref:flavodoxin domain-containing protein n=1 Tax=Halomarina pelagica TaxID=2961599 RepID=UPI0020C3219F|nr:flavodoxin domain-containing protein [Halomarina sp. BND7]
MASILVFYGTSQGQTAKIADRIVGVLRDRGHTAEAIDAGQLSDDFELTEYDAVLVGASIHGGKHQPEVRTLVTTDREDLTTRPTGFCQMCLTATRPDEESQAEAAGYVTAFVEDTGWQPDRIVIFGGALRYSEYGFLKRLVLKQLTKDITGDTDTSRDYEYTDWDEVETFAADFATFVEEQLGIVASVSDAQKGVECRPVE